MASQQPSTATAFNILPIELNKAIAHYLREDRDIVRYRLICRATYHAIDGDNYSFWRARFGRKFAVPPGLSNQELMNDYKLRKYYLYRGRRFQFEKLPRREQWVTLCILGSLVIQSFIGRVSISEGGRPRRCANMKRLEKYMKKSSFLLREIRMPEPVIRLPAHILLLQAALKMICSPFILGLENANHPVIAFEEIQRRVYDSTSRNPLFLGHSNSEVNLTWFLDCLNFFRHHMMSSSSAPALYREIQSYEKAQRPTPWTKPLRESSHKLGAHWRGTYAYLKQKDLDHLRDLVTRDAEITDIFNDLNVEDGKIQHLHLEFEEESKQTWPRYFEQRLNSLRVIKLDHPTPQQQEQGVPQVPQVSQGHPAHSQAGQRAPLAQAKKRRSPFPPSRGYKQVNTMITGYGEDSEEDFNLLGWLNTLPNQCGIPGWQRLTMMKHFEDDVNAIDKDNLWAYEGVVIPGGRLILGRWWYASGDDPDEDFSGPFILWAVEDEDASCGHS